MNVNVYELEKRELEHISNKLKIEDNVGESIHIHIGNTRIELSVDEFQKFASEITNAKEELENGDC